MEILTLLKNQLSFGAFSFDAPQPWQILFQDAATKIMDNITDLHHDIMFFLVLISTFVMYMMVRIITAYRISNTETVRTLTVQHHTWMEVIWTLVPAVILMFIALPAYYNKAVRIINSCKKKAKTFSVIKASCFLFIDPNDYPSYVRGDQLPLTPKYDENGNLSVDVEALAAERESRDSMFALYCHEALWIGSLVRRYWWLLKEKYNLDLEPGDSPISSEAVVPGGAILDPAFNWDMPPAPEPVDISGFVLEQVYFAVVIGLSLWGHYKNYKKKEAHLAALENSEVATNAYSPSTEKLIEPSSLEATYRKYFNSLNSAAVDNKVYPLLEVSSDDLSIKVFGIPLKFSSVPFICLTGSLFEILPSLFLWFFRRYFFCLVRRKLVTVWRSFLFCKAQNVVKIMDTFFWWALTIERQYKFFTAITMFSIQKSLKLVGFYCSLSKTARIVRKR